MTDFFLELLNMSLVSCWLIAALLILRPLLKKAPKAFVCALWGLVGLRLICPFSFESILSLIPTSKPVSEEVILSYVDLLSSSASDTQGTETIIISNTLASPAGASINPMQAISLVAAFIWAVGVAVMLIISLVSYIRLSKSVSASIKTGANVFIADGIASPFVLGFFKPRIYIPSSLTEYEKEFVIAHENAHIKRRDYLLKPLGYLILSLHWFNPLVWVAYILLCRDIEGACDERVIRKMDDKGKKEYSEILLRLSQPSSKLRACPVAFGEVGVKSRIKSVANYKKPAFLICMVAAVLAVVLTVGFLTNPISEVIEDESADADNAAYSVDEELAYQSISAPTLEECISKTIVLYNGSDYVSSRFPVENYVELKTLTFNNNITAYIWGYYGEYEQTESGVILAYENYRPAKVRIRKAEDSYVLTEYNAPYDRKDLSWVVGCFPEELQDSATFTPGYYNDQKAAALEIAKAHFGVSKESNEFFPVFNAEVLEISDRYITVAPLKGEVVSKNTFEKVRLSRNSLSSTSYNPAVGDIVRVRYADIITLDTDPPTLTNVFNLDKLVSKSVSVEMPAIVYAGEDTGEYYIKEPVEDKVYIYKSGDVEVWYPGTYFSLNEEAKTFMLLYKDKRTPDSPARLSSGTYEVYGDKLVLKANDSQTGTLAFVKNGDSYEFHIGMTIAFGSHIYTNYPFADGDKFQLESIS